MTRSPYYPPADRSAQWFGLGGATVAPNKLLWHTTETAGGWPGYGGGASAPNLTYEPWQHAWRQHFPLDGTARALRNGSDGWQTNRQAVCQIEVSCYCDPAQWGTGRGVNRLDQQAYDDMGAFAEFMRAEWGVPLTTGVTYLPYPQSYGATAVRLSRTEFIAYRGHLDHMHAPDNSHGDAGLMDVPRLLAAAQPEDSMSQAEVDQINNFTRGVVDGAHITTRQMIDAVSAKVDAVNANVLALPDLISATISTITDADLVRIADAVADEQGSRLNAPEAPPVT